MSMRLNADTGAGDSNGVWGILNTLGGTASNIIDAVNGNNRNTPAPANNPAPATSGGVPQWVYYAGGGIVLLLVVMMLKKK